MLPDPNSIFLKKRKKLFLSFFKNIISKKLSKLKYLDLKEKNLKQKNVIIETIKKIL
jgi:hypothetical protein